MFQLPAASGGREKLEGCRDPRPSRIRDAFSPMSPPSAVVKGLIEQRPLAAGLHKVKYTAGSAPGAEGNHSSPGSWRMQPEGPAGLKGCTVHTQVFISAKPLGWSCQAPKQPHGIFSSAVLGAVLLLMEEALGGCDILPVLPGHSGGFRARST